MPFGIPVPVECELAALDPVSGPGRVNIQQRDLQLARNCLDPVDLAALAGNRDVIGRNDKQLKSVTLRSLLPEREAALGRFDRLLIDFRKWTVEIKNAVHEIGNQGVDQLGVRV